MPDSGGAGRRPGGYSKLYLLGIALGLLPVALLIAFGFTQCPLAPMGDYTCHDPNQGWGGWFFVFAIGVYLLDALGFVVCVWFRRIRPLAWGLLTLLFVGPIVGAVGMYTAMVARHTGQ
jgi:hypothetical protein